MRERMENRPEAENGGGTAAAIEAVIFDWAGTTVDYGCFAPVNAFVEVFASRGIEPAMDEVRAPMGMLKRDHIKAMLSMPRIAALWRQRFERESTEEDLDQMYLEYETSLLASLKDFAEPKPGVLKTVEQLRRQGIRIGSTTGYTDVMMDIVMPEAAKQGFQPDCCITPDSVGGKGRPYPFMVFENMRRLGVMRVDQVVKVGDTVSDIQEGKNAGVYSVGIIEGSSVMGLTEDEFAALSQEEKEAERKRVRSVYEKAGADSVILTMEELPELLKVIG